MVFLEKEDSLDTGYMRSAFELVKEYGGVTISDEVQTGYGRCGESMWGFEMKNNDVIPDIITIVINEAAINVSWLFSNSCRCRAIANKE